MRLDILTPILLLSLGLAAACGDDETSTGAGGSAGCVDYASVNVNACNGGPCSFANDVVPVFQGACAISSSCHLSGGSPTGEGLGLGPSNSMTPTQMEIDAIHASLVSVTAVRSSLNLVEPGDPGKSWLLAKIDYADEMDSDARPKFSACAALACEGSAEGCGKSMPEIGPLLDEDRASKIRAWIADGAQNN